ncbi:Conserved_hypothetical protein [Hexamita inflata]|uniref:Transmembrane protein n=1 Tax=Hexamita inflata TaxID=28002 RepID=A0AA86UBW5_9EUKA|nr:Conserved hypothetical protein [Hexamita inflata]
MLLIQLSLLDLQIANKKEITDCYTSASYVRLLTIRSTRQFRIYLTPSGKEECRQLPRGLNITVFANKLVDASNNFIPNSQRIFNFTYDTTIGININCNKCTNDNYLQSSQVMITMESAIHYTTVVMGAVQTAKGLQLNCFQSPNMVIDFHYILLTVSNSNNCPQLMSLTNSSNMKSLVLADAIIVYQSGEIDRYESLIIGSEFRLSKTPPVWTSTNTFNVTLTDIGTKALKQAIRFVQFHLYFQNTGVFLRVPIQVNNYTVTQFLKAYKSIDMKIQGGTAYFDMQVNTSVNSTSKLMFYQDYNHVIVNITKPDSVQLQFFGYSNQFDPNIVLDNTFPTSIKGDPLKEPSMSFTMNLDPTFVFKDTKMQLQCSQIEEKDCETNLQRYLNTLDKTFAFYLQIRFYKKGVLMRSMSQSINQPTDSCFVKGSGILYEDSMQITAIKNNNSLDCVLIEDQPVDLLLNLSQTNKTSLQIYVTQMNLSTVDFKYNTTFDLNSDQMTLLENYLANSTTNDLQQLFIFSQNGAIVDYLSMETFYQSNEVLFTNEANKAVIATGCVSAGVCVALIVIHTLIRKISPIILRKKQSTKKFIEEQLKKDDL